MHTNQNGNNRIKWNCNPSVTGLAGMLAAVLVLGAGCATGGRTPALPVGKVPLPVYQEGTTYVYDNGSWETVQAVGSEEVTWRNHRGDISTGSPDFTYRRARWETPTRSGTRRFREYRDWSGSPSATTLWSLAPGKTASFVESGRWLDENNREHTYEAQWHLEVIGRERISVKAGEFDTWKIVGRRFSAGSAYKPSRLREKRVWYYAPAVEHYVKVEQYYPGFRPGRSIELLATIPQADDIKSEAVLNANFQKALEGNRSGSPLARRIDTAVTVATTPVSTYRLASGAYCRRYIQEVIQSGEEKTYFGLACRTPEGGWEVPRR